MRLSTSDRTKARAKELVEVLELLADNGHGEWPTAERLNLAARAFEEMQDYNKAHMLRRAALLLERRERSGEP